MLPFIDENVENYARQILNEQHKQSFYEIRALIFDALPNAEEKWAFKTSFYYLYGPLCYWALPVNKIPYIGFCQGIHLEDDKGILKGLELKYIRHFVLEENWRDYSLEFQTFLIENAEINKQSKLKQKSKVKSR